jgi:mannose-6-phosphate isomerase class I
VVPGKKGLTLRYWDWNRRYDESGRPDPNGRARELHLERALAVTDWASASDANWLARQRTSLGVPDLDAAGRCTALCGPEPDAKVHSDYLRAARLSGTGSSRLPTWNTLSALTVIDGSVLLRGAFGSVLVERGASAAIPAALAGTACELTRAHALVSSVVARA